MGQMVRGSSHSLTPSLPEVEVGVRSPKGEKAPPFRKLELEEDVEAYLGAFETHMECYEVSRGQWSRYLAPILNPDATEVYMALDSDTRRDYNSLKQALFSHYSITRDMYRQKMDKLRRRAGETWIICGKRYLNLVMKWISDCTSVSEGGELLAIDAVI